MFKLEKCTGGEISKSVSESELGRCVNRGCQNGEPEVARSSKPKVECNQETQVRSQRMGIHEAGQVPRSRTVKRTWEHHEALFLIA